MEKLTPERMREALNILRLARKKSTQEFSRASYSQQVQSVFNILEKYEDRSKADIYYSDAEKIAIECGAVSAASYCVNLTERITMYFFNAEGYEVGHYHYGLMIYSDTRAWCNDGKGRVWDNSIKSQLTPEELN